MLSSDAVAQFLNARSAREDRAWAAAAFLAQSQTKERVCSSVADERTCLLLRSSRTAARSWARMDPPNSSSLAEEKRLAPSSVHCSLRSLRLALESRCLPHSLADEERVCSRARPGQRRASLAQRGGRAICRRSQHKVA